MITLEERLNLLVEEYYGIIEMDEYDLKERGYKYAAIGVEPDEIRNKEIYKHYGFTEHLKDAKEVNPDGNIINVEYYRKEL